MVALGVDIALGIGSTLQGDPGVPLNLLPVAHAGADQSVEDADNSGAEAVVLDGSASSDADGTIVSWVWSEGGTPIATGETPTVSLAVGVHTITLTVTDDDGGIDTDVVSVEVEAIVPIVTPITANPAAAAETTPIGRTIWSVRHHEGRWYVGYGDWNLANVGPVDLTYWDGDSWETAASAVGTGSFDQMHLIGDDLFIPITDPTSGTNPDYLRVTGTTVNEVGLSEPSHVHLFGVTEDGSGNLYLVGQYSGGGFSGNPTVWKSTNDGTTWTRAFSITGSGNLYGIGWLNNKLWIQAPFASQFARSSSDGTTWTTEAFRLSALSSASFLERHVEFDGQLAMFERTGINGSGNVIRFSGTSGGVYDSPTSPNNSVRDMCVADGYLYALVNNATTTSLRRRPNWSTAWSTAVSFTGVGRSFHVHNGQALVGGTEGSAWFITNLGTLTPPPPEDAPDLAPYWFFGLFGFAVADEETLVVDSLGNQVVDSSGNRVIVG